jgi:hypothetical protein
MARGIVMCLFAASNVQHSKSVNHVVNSNWGAPLVLLIEWVCIVVAMFVLHPSSASKERDAFVPSVLGGSQSGVETPRGFASIRTQLMMSTRNGSFGTNDVVTWRSDR